MTKWLLIPASLAGLVALISILFFPTFSFSAALPLRPPTTLSPAERLAPLPLIATSTDIGVPMFIKIPKIKVQAAVETVGLTAQGAVGVPKGPANAAWFGLGPRPGESGTAVIDGHYGIWKNGQATVFNKLHELRPGDKLYVTDDRGSITAFVVRRLKIYSQREDAAAVFNAGDDKSHLNLITCEGVWDKVKKSYSGRLVVFTDKE